mmetsp:Transcript_20796/g.32693  ORF Transcript_20796/g.32693 Transcript_20796/m.32693 type:complete len:195 (-) Transcript_20796:541-1125(-)
MIQASYPDRHGRPHHHHGYITKDCTLPRKIATSQHKEQVQVRRRKARLFHRTNRIITTQLNEYRPETARPKTRISIATQQHTTIIMTTGFSNAADWLSHITGPNAHNQIEKKDDAKDPILRDLRDMKDAETKGGVYTLPPPKYERRLLGGAQPKYMAQLHQPKPKFVAQKDPTRGKKGKNKAKSNRLGNDLHMA